MIKQVLTGGLNRLIYYFRITTNKRKTDLSGLKTIKAAIIAPAEQAVNTTKLYCFEYNMNTTFPKAVLRKRLFKATQHTFTLVLQRYYNPDSLKVGTLCETQ